MALTLNQLKQMMRAFESHGFRCTQYPSSQRNPVGVEWIDKGGMSRKYRLWVYEVTHGGGQRSSNENRIQITNAPDKSDGMDHGGVTDLVLGYSPSRDVIVAYDRRWLEKRMDAGDGSPSVQVKEADINAALISGMHHLIKTADFGPANIVTLKPEHFPEYLKYHLEVLSGDMRSVNMASIDSESPSVWQYCLDQGYYFGPDLLARYIAAISAKPFVILAGVSGTGKSKMAELVAEFYSATKLTDLTTGAVAPKAGDKFIFSAAALGIDRSRFSLIPVRPDWIDNQSVMGFINPITGKYESTQALDLIMLASKALNRSSDAASAPRYFMLLDEMNLARVEHYFSDWLACAESRRIGSDGTIVQQPVPLHRHENAKAALISPDEAATEVDIPNSLEIPTNLIVTGTVNVDETTFGFSQKVLDRSMVIEFNEVDLDGMRHGLDQARLHQYRFPAALPPFELPTSSTFKLLPDQTHKHLVAINKILEKAQLHFGYRSANEMSSFILIYNGFLPDDINDPSMLRALDGAILQKVLPRIQGNRARIEESLCDLLVYFRNLVPKAENLGLPEIRKADEAKLPQSYLRGYEMLERLRSFGFVTFFR